MNMKTLQFIRHLVMSASLPLGGVRRGLVLFIFCLLLSPLRAALPTEYAPYDLDGDGTLTAADAQVIYHYILGTADEAITLDTVDLNGDGAVNTADVVRLYVEVNKYMNLGDEDASDRETDRIPVGDGTKPPAARERRGRA